MQILQRYPENEDLWQHQEDNGDWSGLPDDILGIISQKLPVFDRVSFNNVCKSWRSVSIESLRFKRFPWLVMSGQTRTRTRDCFSVLDSKLWHMEMRKSYGGYFWGSFEDWLIMVKPVFTSFSRIHISVLNPFSEVEIILPYTSNNYQKLVLSGHRYEKRCMHLMLNWSSAQLALWSKGAKDWYECVGEEEGKAYTDAIALNGLFYLLTKDYNIRVIDAVCDSSIIKIKSSEFHEVEMPLDGRRDSASSVLRYLVESCGEILLVCRFLRHIYSVPIEFKIYKLDVSDRAARVKMGASEIDDRSIFRLDDGNGLGSSMPPPKNFNWPPLWWYTLFST